MQKVNDSLYYIYGKTYLPVNDFDEEHKEYPIIRFKLLQKGKSYIFTRDSSFNDYPKMNSEEIKKTLADYDNLKRIWVHRRDSVTVKYIPRIYNLAKRLMLGGLNGSTQCLDLFNSFREIFPMSGYHGEAYVNYQIFLAHYGLVKLPSTQYGNFYQQIK